MDQQLGEPRREGVGDSGTNRRQSLNSLVSQISIDFLHVKPERVDEAIDRAIDAVAVFLQADRGFILSARPDTEHRFCISTDRIADPGQRLGPANIPTDDLALPWLYGVLSAGDVAEIGPNGWPDGSEAEQAWLNTTGTRSIVVVPLIAETGFVGAIGVGAADSGHAWSETTSALLRIVGDVIVTTRERKAAHSALQRRIAAEEVIRSIATMVIELSAEELNKGYRSALEAIGSFLEVDRCYLWLAGLADSSEPHLAWWRGERSVEFVDDMHDFDIFRSFPSVANVLAQDEFIILNSIAEVPADAADEIEILQRFSIEAAIISPIRASDSLVGVLVAEMNHESRAWSDIDIMLVRIASQILGGMRVRQKVNEERRRLETQVQHTQKLESMGVFAGGIAHDFNNLLVGILGNAELMLMDTPPESARRKNLEQIESSARRASDLVNQLLTYTGKGHFRIEPLDTSELVANLTTLVRTIIPKKIDLRSELEDGLPLVAGDAPQLRQVVMNLITNAADAIGDGPGRILLFTGLGDFESDYLGQTVAGDQLSSGEYVIIEVTDTGSGMNDETKSKIFDPFFTTKFAGRGLGLASTLGIVRAHHGTINVMTWPQKGTTIQVLLPATAHARPEATETSDSGDSSSEGGTVLVIDDEISVRRVTRSVLEHFGYDVLVAENGMRGLRVLEQSEKKVDLVILDMSMPKMDGEETLRRIRALGEQVPIMLTSGYTEMEISDRVDGLDASAFIGKPFSPKDLIQQVRKLL